jgi:hypothetical protein
MFIIPTGNMAENIRGSHKQAECPACGYSFAVNASIEVEGDPAHRAPVTGCTCPNCRREVPFAPPQGPAPAAPALSGDRVVIGKGLFGAGRVAPQRFDVMAFDFPHAPKGQRVVYLKRLFGLPGEHVAIHRGKVYALADDSPEGEAPAVAREEGDVLPPTISPDERSVELFKQGKFRLLRKPPALARALRGLVYDADHPATDLPDEEWRRWRLDGWTEGPAGTFRSGRKTAEMTYRHLLRGESKPQLITPYCGYNTYRAGTHHGPAPGSWASDLLVECEVTPAEAAGTFALDLARGPDRFVARFDLAAGTCSLERVIGGKAQLLKQAEARLPAGQSTRVRFGVSDERLIAWLGEELVFGDGVEFAPPAKLLPSEDDDLKSPARLTSTSPGMTVKRLWLFHDNHYTAGTMQADAPNFDPSAPDTWRALEESAVFAYRVRSGHYFMLGDNSPESSDSRSWGLVPQANLIGKAYYRYYPFSRAGALP